ncbi:MAG: hypothetical protein ACI8ZM_000553 [Crocinitomix sp.]
MTSTRLLALNMNLITIAFTVLGILVILLIFQKIQLRSKSTCDPYLDNKIEWTVLVGIFDIIIYCKNAGELRFGPTYLHLKSDPNNIFGKHFYGDFHYKTNNGIYFQKWNSSPLKNGVHIKVSNDLVFFDARNNEIKTIISNINSFHWKIEKSEYDEIILIAVNGKNEDRIKVTNPNSK